MVVVLFGMFYFVAIIALLDVLICRICVLCLEWFVNLESI